MNFQLKNENEHFSPLCNEGKSKRNIVSKLYEFQQERTESQVYACFIDGDKVYVYNGEHKELAYTDFTKLFNDNIILTKDLKTNERLQSKADLQKS